MDFLIISHRPARGGAVELYPRFDTRTRKGKDLMTKGGDFYAVWDEENGLWSKSQDTVIDLIDAELDKYKEEHPLEESYYTVKYMYDSDSGSIDKWKKYVTKQLPPNHFHQLDQKIIFANTPVNKKDYASFRLPYSLTDGEFNAWDTLVGRLYPPEERMKIEWAIGAIVCGDSKYIQKFLVFYGDHGTGKSTILKIIQAMFTLDKERKYCTSFDSEKLGARSSDFALEPFKNSPLIAIEQDGDLSKIETNTRLNSLVSHENQIVNAKFERMYESQFNCMLFMGTNKPVRITDSRSGIIRRLIDVYPSGNTFPADEYLKLTEAVKYEYGAIAKHCLDVYSANKRKYNNYIPQRMMGATNDFYNYLQEKLDDILNNGKTTLDCAFENYLNYCEKAKVPQWAVYSRRVFGEELKNYFKVFEERGVDGTGARRRSVYSGFKYEKLGIQVIDSAQAEEEKSSTPEHWLKFNCTKSIFDQIFANVPAQYEVEAQEMPGKFRPERAWKNVTTTLKDIDTSRVHYAKTPPKLIVIDFDIHDAEGNKSLDLNLQAVREKWTGPPTYAEVSKSGNGIHLHYFYEGDVELLSSIFAPNIEIKVYTGGSALRRRLTKCNDIPIATITGGLPLKEVKKKTVITKDIIHLQAYLTSQIAKALNKEHPPGSTKCEMDFIKKITDEAYSSGRSYDVSPMMDDVYHFACNSTNNAPYCQMIFSQIKWKSENEGPYADAVRDRIVFFDIEIFPNLFVVCWKFAGKNEPVTKWINPTSAQVEELFQYNLIGFNNRRYDNHMLYARSMGYSVEKLYHLSHSLINESNNNSKFLTAYNLSYADVYDFCSTKQSLKKWEIQLGIHHQELGLPWDKPAPENMWPLVCEYCANDVIATEVTFNANQADWNARKVLAKLSGLTPNDTTRKHATKIIFGDNENPELVYTNLATGERTDGGKDIGFPGYRFDIKGIPVEEYILPPTKQHKSIYLGEDPSEGGCVFAKPGMYYNVWTFDVTSMHPHSAIALNIFGKYTPRFQEIVQARIAIKHGDMDKISQLLGGSLLPYSQTPEDRKHLAQALKIIINSVYGYTSATFENPFKDPRNVDNIVAKRGALFMMTLRREVEKRGFTVVHVKTDSIKVVSPTEDLIKFILSFASRYGYQFDIEAKYEKMCLVNNAVYIAKYTNDDCNDEPGCWTATGKEFQEPFIFKTLFSHEQVVFEDLCTTMTTQSAFYLDKNEGYPDVTEYENIKLLRYRRSVGGKLTKAQTAALALWDHISDEALDAKIAEGHNYIFVGRAGMFCPMKPGTNAGILLRDAGNGKFAAATGSSGYRWMESEEVEALGLQDQIDDGYFRKLVDDAKAHINEFGSFEDFVADGSSADTYVNSVPYMNPPTTDINKEEVPFVA